MTTPEATTLSSTDGDDIDDLCFTARALAQTHPLTESALRYKRSRFDAERARQPVTDLADWATTAFLVGYCLRRAEETASDIGVSIDECDEDRLSERAGSIAEVLRDGDAASVTLLAPAMTVTALDRIIGTELHKRHEHVRDQLDDEAWSELEDYIAWWVVHGYCVRSVEAPRP